MWKEFIRTHTEVLVATDFFTAEVRTKAGLVTYDVSFYSPLEPEGPRGWRDAAS